MIEIIILVKIIGSKASLLNWSLISNGYTLEIKYNETIKSRTNSAHMFNSLFE